jgi:hypothetical protein
MTLILKNIKETTESFLPFLLLPSLLVLPLGCSTDPNDIISQWKEDGWKLVNFHGQKKPAEHWSKLSSEKAKGVEAVWVENGTRKTKIYPQNKDWVTVLIFHHGNGEKAAAVMKKRK